MYVCVLSLELILSNLNGKSVQEKRTTTSAYCFKGFQAVLG